MGQLNKFDIQHYIDKYNISTFVETGSVCGSGIEHAKKFNFKEIFSTEIIESHAIKLANHFSSDNRIKILTGNSFSVLETILPSIKTNILFWLDAHYPGADIGYANFESEKDLDVRLPLEKEIETIHRLRSNYQDVILCDDLRIYEHGPYESQNMDEAGHGSIKRYGLNFLEKLKPKYNIIKHYQCEGYLEIIPN